MHRRSVIAVGLFALAAIHSHAEQPAAPPEFEIAVSPPFTMSGRVERYRAGDVTCDCPPYRVVTTAAVTKKYGDFGPGSTRLRDWRGWSAYVYATSSKRVAAAYASTKDGYQLGMTDGPQLEIPDEGSYMVARLRRKRFKWGRAVSFLSQFSQDLRHASPESGRLQYEVWGLTEDRKYTVVASVSVGHPKLQQQRSYRTVEALRRDPDYKRIERCKSEEFTPSLTAFDEMLDSLVIR
jgi:hypothetical protein